MGERDTLLIRTCSNDSSDLDLVLRLADRAKKTVGFLPPTAIHERVDRGTVLVAVNAAAVAGYILYDLRRGRVKIGQLVVDPDRRGEGIARMLVEEVAARHSDRQGIELDCRRDFPAHELWSRLGFTPVAERAGRAKLGSRLNRWWRPFPHDTLLTLAADLDERPLAVVDTNVVINACGDSAEPIEALLSDWTRSEVRLGAVPTTYVEIDGHGNQEERNRHKEYLQTQLERLEPESALIRAAEQRLRDALGGAANAHRNDVRLAAESAAAGAAWFVTGDRRFQVAAADSARQVLGIEIVSPGQLVGAVGALARDETYRPVDLMGTDIDVREACATDFDRMIDCFVSQRDGERHRDFRQRMEVLTSEGAGVTTHVFAAGAELLAMAAVRQGDVMDVSICRVRPGVSVATVGRHLLGWLRSIAADAGAIAVELSDVAVSQWSRSILAAEGFIGDTRPIAVPIRGAGRVEIVHGALDRLALTGREAVARSLRSLVEADGPVDAQSAIEIEATFHPFILTGTSRPVFRVPVKASYASDLFDHGLKAGQLFVRDRSLALRREHVYFRSPDRAGIRAPGRILWHVTGDAAHGGGTMRGTSLLAEVIVGDAGQISRRFAHLGVLNRTEIEHFAKAGQVMALRFSHTELFHHPVTAEQYLEAVRSVDPQAGVTWAGPKSVSEKVWIDVLRRSS